MRASSLFNGQSIAPGPVTLRLDGEQVEAVSSGPGRAVGACKDFGEAMIVPGFHDAHTHFLGGAMFRLQVDFAACAGREAFLTRLSEFVSRAGPSAWIRGHSWNSESMAWRPSRADLDRVAPQNPLFLLRNDGHAALVNSEALRRAGVDAAVKDPQGGRFERLDSGGLGSLLVDKAMDAVRPAITLPSEAEQSRVLKAQLQEALRLGLTGLQDDCSYDTRLRPAAVYASAFEAGAPPLRVNIWRSWGERASAPAAGSASEIWDIQHGPLKIFLDGSLGSRTAHLFEAYADEASNYGLELFSQSELQRAFEELDGSAECLAFHAIGDRAVARVLEASVSASGWPRVRIEHAELVRPEDIERWPEHVFASVQPTQLADDLAILSKRLGPERARMAFPLASLLQAQVPLAFGTDFPVAPLDPLRGLHWAVQRRDTEADEAFVGEQCLSFEQAMAAYSVGSAEVIGRGSQLGCLRAGMLADCVVLRPDPRPALACGAWVDFRSLEVAAVVLNGRLVFEA